MQNDDEKDEIKAVIVNDSLSYVSLTDTQISQMKNESTKFGVLKNLNDNDYFYHPMQLPPAGGLVKVMLTPDMIQFQKNYDEKDLETVFGSGKESQSISCYICILTSI